MNVLVLGAGVIGVTSAWYLRRAGFEVTVLERQAAAALETSYANGGQISVSHAEPWANPHVLPKILQWFGRADAPLLVRPSRLLDPGFLRWGVEFLTHCPAARTRKNIRAIVHLALYSRARLIALREELSTPTENFGDAYDALSRGILHFYTDHREFEAAQLAARVMQGFGLDRYSISADECIAREPALADARSKIVGGDYTASDESGDAHRFTQALAAKAAALGVNFRHGEILAGLAVEQGRVIGVRTSNGALHRASAVVVALGSYSAPFLRPHGIALPVYPAKGYSATLHLDADTVAQGYAPTVSLTDDGKKLVLSRLGNRLRVAGTAEFNGFNLDLDRIRTQGLLQRIGEIFPRLRFQGDPNFWCGLRPATPSNVPLIGRSTLPGLWLNTGHGTLGWTLSCGSAAALADLMQGHRPEADFPFLGAEIAG